MESYLFAIGGNSLVSMGEEGNLTQQFGHAHQTMHELAKIIAERPARVVITHGNGPQVGNILFRSEYACDVLYALTLDICVSDSEGGMGYMLQQVFHNELIKIGMVRDVVTIITQVEVDPNDPAMQDPAKYIGQWYTEEEAKKLSREKGWNVKKDADRGWRRVVASPKPVRIIELDVIRTVLDSGNIVIAVGGGGIPVVSSKEGFLHGVEGVVDKDLASALLGAQLGIRTLVIITGVEKVCLNFAQENMLTLDHLTVSEALKYMEEGHFPPGNMGPKIEAAINFLQGGGEKVILTCPGKVQDSIEGRAGTVITH
jgi:carbamate kinase